MGGTIWKSLADWLNGSLFLTALLEWFCCFCYIWHTPRRCSGRKLARIGGGMFLLLNGAVYYTCYYPLIEDWRLWVLFRVPVYVALMWLFCALCAEGSRRYISFLCVKAFLLSELFWSLLVSVRWSFPGSELKWPTIWGMNLAALAAVALLVGRIDGNYSRKLKDALSWREVIVPAVIAALTFVGSTLTFGIFYDSLSKWITFSHTTADLLGIIGIFEYQMVCVNRNMQQELLVMEKLVEEKTAQYELFQESAALIGQKYHDLKHLLFLVKNGECADQNWLEAQEQEIQAYEAMEKTGNSILDTILTDKHLHCQQRGISLCSVIDGGQLQNMSQGDICTIFGNALDNAMECVQRLEKTQRLIYVTVFEQQGFLHMSFDNPSCQELIFQDGLPQTTKGSRDLHGYGLKSIRRTVRKYDGYMQIVSKDGWFQLKLVFPLPLSAAA